MNKLKSIVILVTLMLISTNLVANAEGRNSVRIKYANQNVTDIVYNDEDRDNPYVMIYFDDGCQIRENKVMYKKGTCYVDIKELPKEKPPKSITENGKELVPIRVKYANKNVTDFEYRDEDKNHPYMMIYFDDGSQIRENKVEFKNRTFYVDTKELPKEKPPKSITENGEELIPLRVKYANKNVTDFEYRDKNKNNPYIMVYFDNGEEDVEPYIVIKNNVCYIKSEK